MSENAYKHWWRSLPEAGTNIKVTEIEALVATIKQLEDKLAQLKVRAWALDEKIAKDAVKHWGKDAARAAFEACSAPDYLYIMPEALSRFPAATAKQRRELS